MHCPNIFCSLDKDKASCVSWQLSVCDEFIRLVIAASLAIIAQTHRVTAVLLTILTHWLQTDGQAAQWALTHSLAWSSRGTCTSMALRLNSEDLFCKIPEICCRAMPALPGATSSSLTLLTGSTCWVSGWVGAYDYVSISCQVSSSSFSWCQSSSAMQSSPSPLECSTLSSGSWHYASVHFLAGSIKVSVLTLCQIFWNLESQKR